MTKINIKVTHRKCHQNPPVANELILKLCIVKFYYNMVPMAWYITWYNNDRE